MAGGALVALLNTTNNRCYPTLREFFPALPHLYIRMNGDGR
eukprot:COSAG01_NODE_31362_length_599_cov_0.712000_1_plen_41_part_10